MRRKAPWGLSILTAAFLWSALPHAGWAKTYAETLRSEGSLHHWRLDETDLSTPAKDEAPAFRPAHGSTPDQFNTPGTYLAGVTLGQPSVSPALGTAAHFNQTPDSYIDLGTPQHPCNTLTVEAWIKMDETQTSGDVPIFSRWDGSYELSVNHTDAGAFLNFKIRNTLDVVLNVQSTEPLQHGQWYHVAGSFIGVSDFGPGTASVWVNGVNRGSAVGGGDLKNAGGDDGKWYVGKSAAAGNTATWGGLIDEISIYAYELGAGQFANRIALAQGTVSQPGDFNDDGKIDVLDIDLLSAEIRTGANGAKFDLNSNGVVTADDHRQWVTTIKKTWYGDATLDGVFDTGDFVTVFQEGKFETEAPATWAQGDWDGDGRFGSGDLVLAFQDGGFEAGPRAAVAAVPEPALSGLALLLGAMAVRRRRR